MNFTMSALLAVAMVIATSLVILYITKRLGVGAKAFKKEKQLTGIGDIFDGFAVGVVVVLVIVITMIVLPQLTDLFTISVVLCPQIIIGYTLALFIIPRIRWVEDRLYEST